jgi:hypothetical protein
MAMDNDGDGGAPSSGPGKKTSRSWKTLGGIFPTYLMEAELVAWMRGRSFRPIWIQYLDKWLISILLYSLSSPYQLPTTIKSCRLPNF